MDQLKDEAAAPTSDRTRRGGRAVPPVVEIGLKEIYDQLAALNTNVQILASDLKDLTRQGEDHENRLRALENTRWPLPSVAALVSVAALIVAIIGYATVG
ncbi:hypothetical protein QTQ03_18215 [Micromonospora sp. WMMA1363]|uniref:hypothetical protein n=1 Tax=Micromonospora sp. WMMA1363 TaxID=3053985 RepID=UPI00259CEE37|nr:hypothetical protein [Micromonospora sp. WMMA1363]MDM4721441.1 hypothetical protein [Micromonospora sp. WMMA1363]